MPATFRILASPASFTLCEGGATFTGKYQMVSVAMMSRPLVDRRVTVANIAELAAEVAKDRASLDAARRPYSLRVVLKEGRALRGWNDAPRRFHRDESFGRYENAEA